MRPIRLKIRGLNSFMELQEIDFEKLTQKGLFGIFGPTGSGKSTILDGITLALYGEVARKSTNYINTNSDTAMVSFEFSIREKETHSYRVEREYKREKKTEKLRTKSAKIVEVLPEGEKVLEDKVNSVTAKCEEIIGLKIADFTRTVVLPQGNFSEFLKLTGTDRRNMLERLFNLQKYGDELSIRLSKKIKKQREEDNILEGELNGYENCSLETLQVMKKEVQDSELAYEKKKEENENFLKEFDAFKELWELLQNQKQHLKKKQILEEKSLEIAELEEKIKCGELAGKIMPLLETCEENRKNILEFEKELKIKVKELDILKEENQLHETKFLEAKKEQEEVLPNMQEEVQNIRYAIEEKSLLDKILLEIEDLEKVIISSKSNLEKVTETAKQQRENESKMREELNEKEEKVSALFIPEERKNLVNQSMLSLQGFEELSNQQKTLEGKQKEIADLLLVEKENSKIGKKRLEKANETLQLLQETKTNLLSHSPGKKEEIIENGNLIFQMESVIKQSEEFLTKISESGKTRDQLITSKETLEKEVTDTEQELQKIEILLKKEEQTKLASRLKASLEEGSPCPVCGSLEHPAPNFQDVLVGTKEKDDAIDSLEAELEETKLRFAKQQKELTMVSTNLLNETEKLEDLQSQRNALGKIPSKEEYENKKLENVNLSNALSQYEKETIEIEKKLENARESQRTASELQIQIDTEIKAKELQKSELDEEQLILKDKLQRQEKELNEYLEKLELKDHNHLQSLVKEISDKSLERAKIEEEVKSGRRELEKLAIQMEENIATGSELEKILASKGSSLEEKEKAKEEKKNSILQKAGTLLDLESKHQTLSEKITTIKNNYNNSEIEYDKSRKLLSEKQDETITKQGSLQTLRDNYENNKAKLVSAIKEEGFDSEETVKNFHVTKALLTSYREEVAKYKEDLHKEIGVLEELEEKIKGRELTQEQWETLQREKEIKTEAVHELEKQLLIQKTKVSNLEKELKSKEGLLAKKQKSEYQLSLLDDLDKLFKGKKFVEFVATHQLKYVSMEAGKKLKEITGGNYGLEVDENGKFIIRDYKNGGAERDATTLSGGETFLTSLSLALSLSAQIQLKGTAPLELFFLDEGFGTLDEDLLEVVMDSLERIHHEKLSIGIISHLDSIKNRIPMKLMVTPAESGMGGSKVRIEKN